MIHSILKRGNGHPDFCEDFLIEHTFENGFFLGAVFDGCSSGKDSHFASALFGKILLNICRNYKVESVDKKMIVKDLLKKMAFDIYYAKEKFGLSQDELLATINLMIVETKNNSAFVICIGDGVVNINKKIITIDQNNRPNYMTYELDNIVENDNFEGWFQYEKNIFETNNALDISVSTDGILSFHRSPDINASTTETIDPLDYLLHDNIMITNKAMLGRKCNLLKTKCGLMNYDDIGIIRYLKE